jgi:dipeptidyl aminopeptidase/acylaminoacyl peptidase
MRLFASAAVAALLACAPAMAAPPPASAFGRIPAVVDAELSPSGQRIAILGGAADQRILSIATIDQPGLPILQLGDVEVVNLTWAGDAYVLAKVAYWEKVDAKRSYRLERHIAVTPEAKAVSRFLDTRSTFAFMATQPLLGVTNSPPRALVLELTSTTGATGTMDTRMKRKEADVALAVWSVDPATGAGKLVQKGDADTITWEVDSAGEPRVRLDVDAISHRFQVFGRPKGKAQWSLVHAATDFDGRRAYYGYSEPDEAIYLMTDQGLVKKGLADGAEEKFADSAPSLELVWDPHRNTAVGVASGLEVASVKWLDPEVGAAHGLLGRAFKGKAVDLTGWSQDRTRFIARVASPNTPPVWYLYDKTRKEVSPLAEAYPELKGVELGTTRWITYKARDGLEIPAYLTLPPATAPGAGKRPLIVLPHGGPRTRDTYDFDYTAQFLASRGYAVLQPQFRGSWGFGEAFLKAGQGEWGGKMQTDLLDGIAAAAARGEVDASRVCIVGGSFGGYAALAGVSLHPEAYRCAVAIAGIADLGQLLQEENRLYGRESAGMEELREELGAADKAKLAAMSPTQNVGAIRAPVLLIHGDKDTVVQVAQSERMADLLKAAGKPHKLLVLPDENHYFTKAANRTRMLEAMEAFLAKNLPVAN